MSFSNGGNGFPEGTKGSCEAFLLRLSGEKPIGSLCGGKDAMGKKKVGILVGMGASKNTTVHKR